MRTIFQRKKKYTKPRAVEVEATIQVKIGSKRYLTEGAFQNERRINCFFIHKNLNKDPAQKQEFPGAVKKAKEEPFICCQFISGGE